MLEEEWAIGKCLIESKIMTKQKKATKTQATPNLKDLKAKKNPAGGVFNSSIKTSLTGIKVAGSPCLQTAV